MGVRTEWLRARDASAEFVTEYEDAYGTKAEGGALLLTMGDGGVVAIEGTPDEVMSLLSWLASTVIAGSAPTQEDLARRVRVLADRHTPWNDNVTEWLDAVDTGRDVGRWLLIERSNVNGDYEFSLHEDVESAMGYSAEQEYAEDWEPIAAIDLVEGLRYPLRRGFTTEYDTFEAVEGVEW